MDKSLEAVGGMKSLAASFSLREERCQGITSLLHGKIKLDSC